jgi:hypothetical protein
MPSHFRKDSPSSARTSFQRPASAFRARRPRQRDPHTQFYIAYSFYREGWGHFYNDDALFKHGLDAINRAIEVAPGQRVVVEDQTLGMRSAEEVKAELERGLRRDASDLNPMRVFAPRNDTRSRGHRPAG